MSLFFTNRMFHSVMENPLKLETPLGYVESNIKINGFSDNFKSASNFRSIDGDSFLISRKFHLYEVECLQTIFVPKTPSHMQVDKCFAFIWRIKALDNLDINLNCILDSLIVGSPESGEHLISQSFEGDSINLSIGTEDEGVIQQRAQSNNWAPPRFQSIINSDNIICIDQGIEVNFSLKKEEKIQIHFIVAWNSKKNNDVATWFAVEQSAANILRQVGFE